MKLHNTLTKKTEPFAPLDGKIAKIYSCGPTVYAPAHIGNLASFVYVDVLRRAVKLAGFETQHVLNLTDVDDKTIRESQAENFKREFREKWPNLEENPRNLLVKFTEKYSRNFLNEMREMGCEIGNDLDKKNAENSRKNEDEKFADGFNFTRATENIAEIQNLIKKLLREKIAYISDDGIYFSISEYQKTRKYGQLSRISVEKNAVSRIQNDEYDKENARDFALWKFAKTGEPSWDFEINGQNFAGRPGWHIECSAMSVKNLGQPFDIHTGGVDLIFPHHENEIAQSTAGNQPEKLANFFVHNEHLLVDGKKMAKSENNFYTLKDLKARGFSPLDFRMLVLQSHYRSATNFSWENLEAARNRLKNWRNFAEMHYQISRISREKSRNCHSEQSEASQNSERDSSATPQNDKIQNLENLLNSARKNLLNDLNSPKTLAKIDEIFDEISRDNFANFDANFFEKLLEFIDENLGLKIRETTPDISREEKNLIREREIARAEKNWQKSDELRDGLLQRGIEIRDTISGQIWARK